MTDLRTEWMDVTPTIAAEWLSHANANRAIRQAKVMQYADDMVAGRWQLTGDAFRFNGNGQLDDGNHRAAAVVQSGRTIRSLVIWGLTSAAHAVLDSGSPRNLGDVLKWRGEKDTSQLSSSITGCWRFEREALRNPFIRPSIQQSLEWLDENPRIRTTLGVAKGVSLVTGLSRTAVSIVHFETSRVALADAELFFHHLRVGENLPSSSPIIALKRWADRNRGKRERVETHTQIAYMLKACNAWRKGESLEMLMWRAGGAAAEPFPSVWEGDIT